VLLHGRKLFHGNDDADDDDDIIPDKTGKNSIPAINIDVTPYSIFHVVKYTYIIVLKK
jgi:hypothetical protein